jgi:hypothetical protein
MFATATMDPFSSSPVMDGGFIGKPFGSPSVSRNTSPVASPSKTELDDDFPMDMDESFNSSMSFSFNSTQESPLQAAGKRTGVFGLTTRAPLGQTKSFQTVFDSKDSMAPQRRLGPHRTFGQELTNIASGPSRSTLFTKPKSKGRMLPPALPETPAKGISPAPLKSTLSQENVGTPRFVLPRMGRREVS